MLRIVLLVIACLLLIGLSLAGCGPAGQPVVTFPDPNLEAAMREALNIPFGPIHASDLAGLTSLSASWRGIEDLSGLQYCTNLTNLNLCSNQISDISLLVENAGLSEGDYVHLDENPLSSDSINIYIPQLEARGVSCTY